jgi:NAD(P)-dependent dehydrogenase (short-subunit alcohol dehydrogenase family)
MEQEFDFNNELSGRIALVTGGTKGAGKAIAERLVKAGATVIITARNQPKEANDKLHFVAADLSKPEGTKKVVEEILSTYKKPDILVNNLGASSTPGGGFTVLTDEDWEESLQTNLVAPVRLDRNFLPQMIERKTGVIIHIASLSRVNYHCMIRHCPMQRQKQG